MATRRKADANKAFWKSTKSFYELFVETGVDFSSMSKNLVYTFILSHPENEHVIPLTEPKITHISTRNQSTFHNVMNPVMDWCRYPKYIESIESIESINANHTYIQQRGIIATYIQDPINSIRYKIDFPSFAEAEYLLKNQPNIILSYLHMNRKEKFVAKLVFPQHRSLFAAMDETLDKMVRWLSSSEKDDAKDRILKDINRRYGIDTKADIPEKNLYSYVYKDMDRMELYEFLSDSVKRKDIF